METAIFPSYFHGKCQRFSKDGQDPPGCPNPDCPVVCGTPGSLVHFYSTLRFIAFNDTKNLLEGFAQPGSQPYAQIEGLVKSAQVNYARSISAAPTAKRNNVTSHTLDASSYRHSFYTRGLGSMASRHIHNRHARAESASSLKAILSRVGALLGTACGGSVGDGEKDLPDCSWEAGMKAYILSFP